MRSRIAAIFIVLTAMAGTVVPPASASKHPVFDEAQWRAIESTIREFIRQNPEIILEVLQTLQERPRLSEAGQSPELVAANRDALLNDPGSPVGGNPDGDVTIVEFFDYQCPYCKRVMPKIRELLEQDPNVRFVYKEWPILGPMSEFASRAALASWRQGKYEQFHAVLMSVKGRLTKETIFFVAREIGLDVERMKRDMNSAEVDAIYRRNFELADKLGFRGTPAFVVGDVFVPGAVDLDGLMQLVETAREDG